MFLYDYLLRSMDMFSLPSGITFFIQSSLELSQDIEKLNCSQISSILRFRQYEKIAVIWLCDCDYCILLLCPLSSCLGLRKKLEPDIANFKISCFDRNHSDSALRQLLIQFPFQSILALLQQSYLCFQAILLSILNIYCSHICVILSYIVYTY